MKKRIIKVISLFLVTLVTVFMFSTKVSAASASISVKAAKSTVVVGGSFNVTVTVSSASSIGAWEFNLTYDTSKLQLTSVSPAPHVADYAQSAGKKSASYTYTFKAKATGNASISVSSYSVVGWDEQTMSTSGGSTSVKVITQQELEASYSKNNSLSSLSVEGSTLTPTFNKDTLEYAVELEPNTTSIKISAKAEDSKSSISGIGDIEVTDGDNKIEIKVTAENGSVKTYVINAKVK